MRWRTEKGRLPIPLSTVQFSDHLSLAETYKISGGVYRRSDSPGYRGRVVPAATLGWHGK
jgi:hypothetical protein